MIPLYHFNRVFGVQYVTMKSEFDVNNKSSPKLVLVNRSCCWSIDQKFGRL